MRHDSSMRGSLVPLVLTFSSFLAFAFIGRQLIVNEGKHRDIARDSHHLKHSTETLVKDAVIASLSPGESRSPALLKNLTLSATQWEANHRAFLESLQTMDFDAQVAAGVKSHQSNLEQHFGDVKTHALQIAKTKALGSEVDVDALLQHQRQFASSLDSISELVADAGHLRAIYYGNICLGLVGMFVLGSFLLYRRQQLLIASLAQAVAEIDAWNESRLDESVKLRNQQNDLAREIFTSRRAEEELRSALADVWQVAAKMQKAQDEEPMTLKAAIPLMAARSRISS